MLSRNLTHGVNELASRRLYAMTDDGPFNKRRTKDIVQPGKRSQVGGPKLLQSTELDITGDVPPSVCASEQAQGWKLTTD